MRWRVEISDVAGNDRLLREVLGELSIDSLDEQDARFLFGAPFEILDTAGDVHALVSRLQSIVEEVGKQDSEIGLSFKVGNVFEKSKDGAWRKHAFLVAEPGRYEITGHAATLKVEPSVDLSEDERKRLEEEHQEREYQQLRRKAILRVVPAFRDDRALQVQRLLQGDLTPQTMGHIADLIQDDIGGAMRDLISGNQLTRFYRSINHPDVFGEHARHIVSNVEPPPNPMSLGEARQFIRDLATRWLERKAGLHGNA